MKVHCMAEYCQVENEHGLEMDAVIVRCGECDHEVMSYGHGERSVRRCLALLREECPNKDDNFYAVED